MYIEVQVVILAITPFNMSTALQEMEKAGRYSVLMDDVWTLGQE